jgi:alpha-glucosidase
MWQRSGHANLGRDGCRVPLPWSGDRPPFGFLASPHESSLDGSSSNGSSAAAASADGTSSDPGARTWLPQPPAWAGLTVEAEAADPDSMLNLYRRVLAVRHREPAFATDSFAWLAGPDDVLCYRRGTDVTVMINVSGQPATLPPHEEILAASHRVTGGVLPPGTGVWLRTRPPAS